MEPVTTGRRRRGPLPPPRLPWPLLPASAAMAGTGLTGHQPGPRAPCRLFPAARSAPRVAAIPNPQSARGRPPTTKGWPVGASAHVRPPSEANAVANSNIGTSASAATTAPAVMSPLSHRLWYLGIHLRAGSHSRGCSPSGSFSTSTASGSRSCTAGERRRPCPRRSCASSRGARPARTGRVDAGAAADHRQHRADRPRRLQPVKDPRRDGGASVGHPAPVVPPWVKAAILGQILAGAGDLLLEKADALAVILGVGGGQDGDQNGRKMDSLGFVLSG